MDDGTVPTPRGGAGLLYMQIWAQVGSQPFTAQGPRTGFEVELGSSSAVQRRFERHVDFGPQQALEPGHRVLLGERVPSNL